MSKPKKDIGAAGERHFAQLLACYTHQRESAVRFIVYGFGPDLPPGDREKIEEIVRVAFNGGVIARDGWSN